MRIPLIFTMFVLLLGCSDLHPGHVPVTVQVNDNGKPVDGVSVTFVADDGSYAVGYTEPDGTAQMYTYKPKDGVKPGSYLVKLSKYEKASLVTETYDPATDKAIPISDPVSLIPIKFSDIKTSELSVVVEKKILPLVFDVSE